jgi:hypothetical protein
MRYIPLRAREGGLHAACDTSHCMASQLFIVKKKR